MRKQSELNLPQHDPRRPRPPVSEWDCPLCGDNIDYTLQSHLRNVHKCDICLIGFCDCHHNQDNDGEYVTCVCGEVFRYWDDVYVHLKNPDGKCMSLIVLATTGV